jgi:hypothetical protein
VIFSRVIKLVNLSGNEIVKWFWYNAQEIGLDDDVIFKLRLDLTPIKKPVETGYYKLDVEMPA